MAARRFAGDDGRLQHDALGKATKADVNIRWPAGGSETLMGVEANQWIVARESKGIVERHRFAAGGALR